MPSVITSPVEAIALTTVTLKGSVEKGGNAPSFTSGFVYSHVHAVPNLTQSEDETFRTIGSTTGALSEDIENLIANKLYYVRAYATNAGGTSYGVAKTFATDPTISTSAASSIAGVSATLGGSVALGGGATIKEHGLVIEANSTPTISDRRVLKRTSAPVGNFSGLVDGLVRGTVYKVRAYAIKGDNVAVYGNEINFTTVNHLTVITTPAIANNITTSSAILGGNITGAGGSVGVISSRGVYLKTSSASDYAYHANANGSGVFSKSHPDLTSNTFYNFKATAVNQAGRTDGSVLNFTTKAVVTNIAAASIGTTTATVGGAITPGGHASIAKASKGVYYGLSANPSVKAANTSDGAWSIRASLSGLSSNRIYSYRSYATNAGGESKATSDGTFTTRAIVRTENLVSNIGSNAVFKGNLTSSGVIGTITALGVEYSTTSNYTSSTTKRVLASSKKFDEFTTVTATGLAVNQKYYYRAFVTNAGGTSYGSVIDFWTGYLPKVTTKAASYVSKTTARLNGTLDDAGRLLSSRCFRYSLNSDMSSPTTKCAASSSIAGAYSVDVDLLSKRTYYFETYASNSAGGPVYGQILNFRTQGTPIVVTNEVMNISHSAATLSGTVSDVGGLPTQRGFYYSTNSDLSSGTRIDIGTSSEFNTFTYDVELEQQTTYYICAYAKNDHGTVYGETKTITTLGGIIKCGEKIYELPTGSIGENCWMTANIGYHTNTFGAYYTWEEANAVCLEFGYGWSLPTKEDFDKLGSSRDPSWNQQYGGYQDGGSFSSINSTGAWWSSTPSGDNAWQLNMVTDDHFYMNSSYSRTSRANVRCINTGISDTSRFKAGFISSYSEYTTIQEVTISSSPASLNGTNEGLVYAWFVNGEERSETTENLSLGQLPIGEYSIYRKVTSSLGSKNTSTVSFTVRAWNCGEKVYELPTDYIGGNCWMIANIGYHADKFGAYYTWAEANGICSTFGRNWELPTKIDFENLESEKALSWSTQLAPNANWWSSTEIGTSHAWFLSVERGESYSYTIDLDNTSSSKNVRCVRSSDDISLSSGSITSPLEYTHDQEVTIYNSSSASVSDVNETLVYTWFVNGIKRSETTESLHLGLLTVGDYRVYRMVSSSRGSKNTSTVYFTVNSALPCGVKVYELPTDFIGGNCWMTANVGYHTNKFGAYYTWAEAKNVCQKFGIEWRLPTKMDFENLGASKIARWNKQLGGYRGANNIFVGNDSNANWWSSTDIGSSNAWYLHMKNDGSFSIDLDNQTNARSVRCVRKPDKTKIAPVKQQVKPT